MYFKITYQNGYCGCDEEYCIKANTEEEAIKYAGEAMPDLYPFYDDASQCINDIEDYDDEEEYWEDFAAYQENCDFMITELSEEEDAEELSWFLKEGIIEI